MAVNAFNAIAGFFQRARLEGSLNAIELNTRRTSIQTVDHIQPAINKYWPYMEHTNTAVYATRTGVREAVYSTGAATVEALGRVVTAIGQQSREVKVNVIGGRQYSFADEPNEKLFDLTRNERRVMA